MSRRRKGTRRQRRKFDKEKQAARKAPVCDCESERFGGWHTGTCPAWGTPGAKSYGKPKGNAKNSAYYDYGSSGYTSYGKAWCSHWRTPVELEEGLTVYASSYSDRPKFDEQDQGIQQDFGVYMDDMWTRGYITATPGLDVPWAPEYQVPVVHLPWTDYQAPNSVPRLAEVCDWILEQAALGKKVDIGCIGGHGRTGSVLSALLIAQGMDPWDAVERIRDTYCDSAVESWNQEQALGELWSLYHNGEEPPKSTLPAYAKKAEPRGIEYKGCSECGRDVYDVKIHRQSCNGHPTDEEIAEQKKTNPSIHSEWTDCQLEGCRASFLGDFEFCFSHRTLAKRKESTLADDDAYREWLALNARGIEDAQVRDHFQDQLTGWPEDEALNEHYREMAQSVMDDACPMGHCQFPMDCDPEGGSCFRRMTRSK